MTRREEIINNIGYQMTHAAMEYIQAHEFSDRIDNFEAGAEWMQEKLIDEFFCWLITYSPFIASNIKTAKDDFKKYLER